MCTVYTINTNPVASNGSCASTGAVLDPTNEKTTIPCNSDKPANCLIGDLAGKHGAMPGPNFAAKYVRSSACPTATR